MVCRKREWHAEDNCEDSDVLADRQFHKVRKLNSDLFNTRGTVPPAQHEIMTCNTTCSKLLRLPPEVRLRIYAFVLGGQQIWVGQTSAKRGKMSCNEWKRKHSAGKLYHFNTHDGSGPGLDLRILRVCRQVFMEAALLPYWQNGFTFEREDVRRAFERIVRPGKKLAQKKAVGVYGVMGWREFRMEVLGIQEETE